MGRLDPLRSAGAALAVDGGMSPLTGLQPPNRRSLGAWTGTQERRRGRLISGRGLVSMADGSLCSWSFDDSHI